MSVSLTEDIPLCHSLRRIVFTHEQGVSEEEEVDGLDDDAIHFLAELNGSPVGTARILIKGDTAKIGRVCVLKEARGTQQGQALIRACIDWSRKHGLKRAVLGSQLHALGFYEALGFTAFGQVYDDAGIEHRDMELHL
ncbi:MAG: GNAT family N-acetyltransferase [Planktotalea sp.]|uniref:GNAT family N-acetyltransferase n=1 Tax=Planktotalea sp. TaxID=2029877 RepID=UPI003C72EBDB